MVLSRVRSHRPYSGLSQSRSTSHNWSRVGHPGIMPKIQPSARNQYVLDPDLKIEAPAPSEVAPDKKKMDPRDQRKYAASKPRHSFKNLPEGWTREKVARAYETAPLRGILKSTWLEKRAEKYDFPLCRWKVRRWVKKCIKSDANEESDSEESSNESD